MLALIVVVLLAISAGCSPGLSSSMVPDKTLEHWKSFKNAMKGIKNAHTSSSKSLQKANFAINMLILHDEDVFTESIGRKFVEKIIIYDKPEYLPFVLLAPNVCDFLNLPTPRFKSAFVHADSHYSDWMERRNCGSGYGDSSDIDDNISNMHNFFTKVKDRCAGVSLPSRLRKLGKIFCAVFALYQILKYTSD
uniref:Uncharacterized protein n=1 Tax=Spongospora subterranea TaxID=70186 RepID=A0A0H5R2Q4_9EUKA|eukprot:CRZ08231.1 hypothetical protein [Spongospora subterranea]